MINAISNYYTNSNSNVHRGVYELAEDAENLYHQARKSIAKGLMFLGKPNYLCPWSNRRFKFNSPIFWPSCFETRRLHDFERNGASCEYCSLANTRSKDWFFRFASATCRMVHWTGRWISREFSEGKVKLIALTAISNTLGTINPIEDIVSEAQQYGIKTVIDGAQSVPHQKNDFPRNGLRLFLLFRAIRFMDQWELELS